jgi:hypothetical protein
VGSPEAGFAIYDVCFTLLCVQQKCLALGSIFAVGQGYKMKYIFSGHGIDSYGADNMLDVICFESKHALPVVIIVVVVVVVILVVTNNGFVMF